MAQQNSNFRSQPQSENIGMANKGQNRADSDLSGTKGSQPSTVADETKDQSRSTSTSDTAQNR